MSHQKDIRPVLCYGIVVIFALNVLFPGQLGKWLHSGQPASAENLVALSSVATTR